MARRDRYLQPTRLFQRARANAVSLLLLSIPLLLFVYLAWTHRWMSDDGFINIRVVQQIFAGNGPVFNAGERVEASTSPLWILCLVVGKGIAFWLPAEWVAVLLGMTMTAAAIVLGFLAAARIYRTAKLVPCGAIVYVAIPPAAWFASSGLENGLTLLWIAGCYLALVLAAQSPTRRASVVTAVIIGLAPLIRPDLTVMAVVFGAVLLWVVGPRTVRRWVGIAGAALILPLSYQVFRMAYYGSLLPNPAYAKEATSSDWSRGWTYVVDLVGPYWLWLPAALVVIAALMLWRFRGPSALAGPVGPEETSIPLIVQISSPIAALAYAVFVVRVGGDFMHGRLLLPSVFALLLPIAAVPRRPAMFVLAGALSLWAIGVLRVGGPPYQGIGPHFIANTYELTARDAHRANPVSRDDFRSDPLAQLGLKLKQQADAGTGDMKLWFFGPLGSWPLSPDRPSFTRGGVVAIGGIGLVSVSAGPQVYVADQLGLASPIGSRITMNERVVAGHEKVLPFSWTYAMFGELSTPRRGKYPGGTPPADVAAARRALTCPDVEAMLDRARAPLTPGRLWNNFVEAVSTFSTRIDGDPAAEAAQCGR